AVAEPGVGIACRERGRAGGEFGELVAMGREVEATRGAKRVLEQRVGRDRLRGAVMDLELARAGPPIAPARRVPGSGRRPGAASPPPSGGAALGPRWDPRAGRSSARRR